MYLDIPNLRDVNLPNSFDSVQSKSIESIDNLVYCISFIDVTPILADLVKYSQKYVSESEDIPVPAPAPAPAPATETET